MKKNSKKIRKIKKRPLWLVFKPKQVGKGRERVKIKIKVPIISYPTRYRQFQKNSKKIKKIKKIKKTPFRHLFKGKHVGKGRKRVKIKFS